MKRTSNTTNTWNTRTAYVFVRVCVQLSLGDVPVWALSMADDKGFIAHSGGGSSG